MYRLVVGDNAKFILAIFLFFFHAAGIEANHFFITSDFNSELFRVAALGSAPTNMGLIDRLLAMIAWIGLPIWRSFSADRAIRKYRTEHLKSFDNLNSALR